MNVYYLPSVKGSIFSPDETIHAIMFFFVNRSCKEKSEHGNKFMKYTTDS